MKETKVVFANPKLKQAYDNLEYSTHEDRQLHKLIKATIDVLKINPLLGIKVPKKLIPKAYQTDNLRKINLTSSWRLMYMTANEDITIFAILLEWLPHKKYERKFKYRKI